MKVTVVGAGNVGATVANVLATKKFCSEIVLVDIKDGVPQGKAMDIMQTAHMLNFDTTVTGVTAEPNDPNGYAPTAGSEVVVITSGMPRKPGMSREDLIGVNAKIVKSVVDQALKFSPNAYFIIISNPMDAMTFLTLKDSKLPRNRVLGQGGLTPAASVISSQRLLRRTAILQRRQTSMLWSSAVTATRRWFRSSASQRSAASLSRSSSPRKFSTMSSQTRRSAAQR